MTKTAKSRRTRIPTTRPEPRPFLRVEPRPIPQAEANIDPIDVGLLATAVQDHVPAIVRALVNHTIALQNRRQLETGHSRPIAVSVLNRRRRSARAWIQSILAGRVDRPTLHALTHTWIPQLAGTGPEPARAVRTGIACMEFLRGAITAQVFDAPADNLVPEARALNALETVLGVHLQALREVVRRRAAR